MASGQARVALRCLSATPLGYGVLPVRTSMYIPKRQGEAQLSVQHGAPRERCCDPPPRGCDEAVFSVTHPKKS